MCVRACVRACALFYTAAAREKINPEFSADDLVSSREATPIQIKHADTGRLCST